MSTLTSREIVRRINRWAKKPGANVPVCYHHESHGRLRARMLNDDPILAYTKCSFKFSLFGPFANLPRAAFRK